MTRGVLEMLVYQKPYVIVLLHNVIFSSKNFGKMLCKVHFCTTIMARKSMKDT